MLFNSIEFMLFLPITVFLFFALPHRFRWILLLAASYFFYAWWKFSYLFLIIISTLIDYFAGIMMGRYSERRKRFPWLVLSLCSNLAILIGFKYFNFFSTSLSGLLGGFGITYDPLVLNVLLPVGISFYTFQTMAYSIDVYRDTQKPERHLGIFALYVAFFPQLVAGPIERSQNLIPQFSQTQIFDDKRIVNALTLILWGFFKKLVIADRLAVYVNTVYADPGSFNGPQILIATYFFAFQIYCDFSAYSDIAIGTAQIMGFKLMDNFKRPYFAESLEEFWRRWHISLSTWFRDYLYIPLGGNRVLHWRWYFNLFIVFVISGLWHGSAWTFVSWGALHGIYLIISYMTQNWRNQFWSDLERVFKWTIGREKIAEEYLAIRMGTIRKYFAILTTFHLVLLSWIFFRAESMSDVLLIFQRMFIFKGDLLTDITLRLGRYDFIVVLVAIGFMESVHLLTRHRDIRAPLSERASWYRWSFHYVLIMIIALFGMFSGQQFIYFQF